MDDPRQKLLALTFDDGPNDTVMVQIINLLNLYDAKATFFVVGNNFTDRSAPVLKKASEQGFEIGNHSWSHLHMSGMGKEEMIREINCVQELVEKTTGIRPVLFRPPYLDVDENMLKTIEMPFISGAGNYDWDPDCPVEKRIALALGAAADGAILLMHCFEGNEATVEALQFLLPELQRQGYQMVTVSQLFHRKNIPLKNGVIYEHTKFPEG